VTTKIDATISENQREILDALAGHWEVLRWRCNDGTHRWHMGEMEVDGRAVRGLWRRGLVEIDMLRRLPSLVLTAAGKATMA
jgi:hypothetical protein